MRGESQCQRPKRVPATTAGPPFAFCAFGRTDVRWPVRRSSRAEITFLRLHVDDVGVVRVDAGLEAVAATDRIPVAGADTDAIDRARRSTDGAVVLCSTADGVERPRIVHVHPVELRQRHVGEVPPGLHSVVGFVEPAVVAQDHVVLVCAVEHDFVVIDVDPGSATCSHVLPPSTLRSTAARRGSK